MTAFNNKDYETAADCFQKAAEQGYARAQEMLGECYAKGHGVVRDRNKAVYWLTKAAEKGNADAKEFLKKMK